MFQMFLPLIASQKKRDLGQVGMGEAIWNELRRSPLLWQKGEKVNLGKYMHPVTVSAATILDYGEKSYLYNVAALSLGHRGLDRRQAAPAAPSAGSAAGSSTDAPVAVEGRATLAQHAHQSFTQATANQLDKAAWLYGDLDNLATQTIIINALKPTAVYHGK